ncbi:hypothetical protein HYALB_00011050 [Hymenoscyphus albidus]|uniref:ABC-type Fe3+ transport system n=1 Tax=Hymenoscyphus albidus TaxID=595503 RepID=A0A9N9LP26_9HELO|nr:hypothetical protein HYALB_00011050 [Hymenoscyphus albidus]
MRSFLLTACMAGSTIAYDSLFAWKSAPIAETRTLDELHAAALTEGGVINLWSGGDEPAQQNQLKTAFEARFPGMTLNVTVDVSKYHAGRIDRQLNEGKLQIDATVLQTVQDFPRWAQQGVLLNYKPVNFDLIDPSYRDSFAAWYGVYIINWSTLTNPSKLAAGTQLPVEWDDFLRPEFKDKLVVTYPNDDDAVLFAFDLIMQQYGIEWFESFLKQNPFWVRGTETPGTIVRQQNSTYAVAIPSSLNRPSAPLNATRPTTGQFAAWPQTGAIFKDAPHPESAKLLFNYYVSNEFQELRTSGGSWSVRTDIATPAGVQQLSNMSTVNTAAFGRFMADRARVERLKFYFESVIGPAQGLSPLVDGV